MTELNLAWTKQPDLTKLSDDEISDGLGFFMNRLGGMWDEIDNLSENVAAVVTGFCLAGIAALYEEQCRRYPEQRVPPKEWQSYAAIIIQAEFPIANTPEGKASREAALDESS